MLSNTNALHWTGQRESARVRSLFTRNYLSFELGIVKPDAEIFEHVVADLGCAPGEIVYFDDNQVNVDAALGVGLDAALAGGPLDCRSWLMERGILD